MENFTREDGLSMIQDHVRGILRVAREQESTVFMGLINEFEIMKAGTIVQGSLLEGHAALNENPAAPETPGPSNTDQSTATIAIAEHHRLTKYEGGRSKKKTQPQINCKMCRLSK